ncbi:ribokinase [Sporolactobacillus terrae]|uniref:ribokinase n=1 Tax=Sporolactobacillus terrae TaxID=269673 RepID=UPI00111A7E53|nr:ribokinase [Sporolactobacillus terrae]UAK16393.1 ribokinase [Sporolactobacillus terrae]
MKSILVIGSFMTDLVIQSDRFVNEGETLIGNSFGQFTGGKGANQAVAAARLGGTVEMIGKLGTDSFGKDQIASLEANGIAHSHVMFTDKTSSGIGNPQLDCNGRNRIVIVPGANFTFTSEQLIALEDVIKESDIIILQLEIPIDTVYEAIKLGKRNGKIVLLNPAPAQKLDLHYAPMVDYIIPNEHEVVQLTGGIVADTEPHIRGAAEALLKQGYNNVLITLGEKGSYFKNASTEINVPAYKVKAIDTTAAGDSYVGAFAYGVANDWSIEKTMRYAAAASALTVTKMGAQPSLPSKDEVDHFLEERKTAI